VKLLLKSNLVFVLIFLLGLVATGAMTRRMLERNAQQETLQQARLLLEKALAVRSYTSTQVAPLLETQMKYAFLPQSVPAFSATEVLARIQKSHPEYAYKEATLNPTNLRDRAADWEADLIQTFRNHAERQEILAILRERLIGLDEGVAEAVIVEEDEGLELQGELVIRLDFEGWHGILRGQFHAVWPSSHFPTFG
jgi:hypothetical protein